MVPPKNLVICKPGRHGENPGNIRQGEKNPNRGYAEGVGEGLGNR